MYVSDNRDFKNRIINNALHTVEFIWGEGCTHNDTQAGFLSLFAELAKDPLTGEDVIAEIKDAMTPIYFVDPTFEGNCQFGEK